MKEATACRARSRAHRLLLSAGGTPIQTIAKTSQVHRVTVSAWIKKWEQHGAQSLHDHPRIGRPPKLTPDEQELAKHLSLSRLNHWLPRGQAHPEVVQGTAEFHHQITDTLLPQADPVFHDATALHTAVDMLDPQPTLVERLVRPLLLPRERLAAGFLRRHEDLDLR